MALQKQPISLPFSQGLNTKIDDKQAPLGTIEVLENVVFDEPGVYKKRTGYDKIDVSILNGSDITEPEKITTFKDELCIVNPTNLYSYSESTSKWTNKGTISNIFPTSTSVVRNSYQQYNCDSLYNENLSAYAWQDTRGGIRISLIDQQTGNELISDTQLTASGTNPRIQSIGNTFYFFYIDSASVKYKKIQATNPNTISSEVTIVSADLHATNKVYDTVNISNRVCIAYNSAASTLKMKYLLLDETITTAVEFASESPSTCIDLMTDMQSRLAVCYYNGSAVRFTLKNLNLTANLVTPTTIETIANVTNVALGTADDLTYSIVYEISAASVQNHKLRSNTITSSATVGTAADFIRSCGLASKIFVQNDNLYVAALHQSPLQSTIFILNSSAEVVSKIAQTISGNLITAKNLPKISRISDETFLFAHQIKGRSVSENNTLFSLLGINKTILDFNNPIKYDNARLGENLHFTGGMLQSYDGKEIVEHGFHLFPENVTAGSTSSTGGSMSDGTYQYSAIYSWIDNKGYQHRSAPSVPITVVLSAGTTTQQQTINIDTLRITEKSNVTIELYRTEGTGTVFYQVTSITSPTYNDPTVDSIAFVDTLADTTILSNELLYTTSDELENIAAPAASIIEAFQNRLFLAGLEDGNKIQYSKIREDGKPVEFNDTLTLQINPIGGPIKALAAMGDKLIIFKNTSIFYLSGGGPNNQGEQDTFIDPELVSSDVGCVNQNSVVLMPSGLMFKSEKGIFLLDSALTTSYIGAPVEDYNNLNVKSATFIPNENQVMFITNGDAIIYNYFSNQWATFTNHQGISATILNNDLYYIRNNNDVFKSANHFTDNGSFIRLRIETSWMSFAGIQGYQRVYRALLLGKYKSAHKLTMEAAYNFVDAYTESKTIDASDFTTDSVYGESATYGSESPYGGTGNQYQFRLDFAKQKCESIRLRITESQDSNYGEGLQMSNILIVVGAKASEFKPAQGRIYGSIKGS